MSNFRGGGARNCAVMPFSPKLGWPSYEIPAKPRAIKPVYNGLLYFFQNCNGYVEDTPAQSNAKERVHNTKVAPLQNGSGPCTTA